MSTIDDYKKAVIDSRLLNPYQRDGLLDGAEEMPEQFLQSVTKILNEFDGRSKKREEEYKQQLAAAFAKYKNTIRSMKDVNDEEKQKLIDESQTLESSVLSQVS